MTHLGGGLAPPCFFSKFDAVSNKKMGKVVSGFSPSTGMILLLVACLLGGNQSIRTAKWALQATAASEGACRLCIGTAI